jgi:hypothetical protein
MRLGAACGSRTAADNCGVTRTVSSCGTCTAPQTCGGQGTPNVCETPQCTFTVTTNVYDGPNWWGTITFRNNGPASSSNYKVEFDVPNNVHCTADAVPSGATLSPLTGSGTSAHTVSNHCIFTWTNAPPLAVNASKTFNYSTDAQNFSAASNVTVSDTACRVCTAENDAAFCTRLGRNCGTVVGTDNCGFSRTVASCGTCTAPQTCGGGGSANVCGSGGSSCSFTVTRNVYDPPNWSGTIAFKNDGPNNASNYSVVFTVPTGVHCDGGSTGWTFTQSGSVCTYVRPSTTLVAGASPTTLTISTDSNSSSFRSVSNLVVADSVCTGARISQVTVFDSTGTNAEGWAARTNFQVGSGSSGAHPWPDFATSYVDSIDAGISGNLLGKPWIQTMSASKLYNPSSAPLAEARVSFNAASNIYLIVDDRVPTATWSGTGWTDSTFNLVVKEAGTTNRTFSVWRKLNQVGSVDLPIQNFNSAFNYFVVVE